MRIGRKHKPFYRIVAMPAEQKRGGKALDMIGYYNPIVEPKVIEVNMDKYNDWISKGAQPTATVKSLVSKAGK